MNGSEHYIAVAQADGIAAGMTRRIEINGRAILIVNIDGHSHEDSSLSPGCPLHGSRFSVVTGEPLRTTPLRVVDNTIEVRES